MKLYLSSYRLGNNKQPLLEWLSENNNKILVIPNALDVYADSERKTNGIVDKCKDLEELGFKTQIFDLRKYFDKKEEMLNDLKGYNAFYVLGGNTFTLRTAMKLSGFDDYLKELVKQPNYLYSGFSAGICVLSKNLHGIEGVDDCNQDPYNYGETIWDGVGLIDYLPVPHFDSPEHPESHLMYGVVHYLEKNKLPYKTLKDGDVIISDTCENILLK